MKSSIITLIMPFFIPPALGLLFPAKATSDSYDILIEGGKILDGKGDPGYLGDVGVRDGLIARIGDMSDSQAIRRIDARGLVVAPGFIDIHTHADEEIGKLPLARNYIQQGVTTVIGGNCGESIYPVGKKLAALKQSDLGINFGLLVGHGTIRKKVMGMVNRSPTQNELAKMKGLVAKAMEQGALGLSTGLYYAPGSYAKTGEIIELAKVVARYGGIYASHLRDESDYTIGLVAAVREAIEIGEKAKVSVHISHLKALGKPVWGKSLEVLNLLEEASAGGIDVTFDQYPYVATETTLKGALVPRWAQEGGDGKMKKRFLDPAILERVKNEMALAIEKRGGPQNLFISTFSADPRLEGKHLSEIGETKGMEPVDAAIDLLVTGRAEVISLNSMLDEDLLRIMQSPIGMVASDSHIVESGKGVPHPRYYGTFPRVLGKYVREEGVLTLEEAVRKMTCAPANRMGLLNRGLIKEGMIADITVFNPDTIKDRATFGQPHQHLQGIDYVIVNGQVAISKGEWAGMKAGKVIYREHYPQKP